MPRQTLYLWKQAPFLRLVIPLIAGIATQWYGSLPVQFGWIGLLAGVLWLGVYNLPSSFFQFRFGWLNGIAINYLFFSVGLLTTFYKDVSHQQQWITRNYQPHDMIIATLQEPISEKENTYKALAAVQQIFHSGATCPVQGNIILYFKKDSLAKQLGYGSQIVFSNVLQPIQNSGNPGSFDYKRYAAFQGIYHQVFLSSGSYVVLPAKKQQSLKKILFTSGESVRAVITRYIPGEKEAGMAEALLVGYKDDLDKTLVQSYSNTGVVHIIAISGMHLGLIYWLLNLLLRPLKKQKHSRWLAPVLVIAGLWLFSFLAGGGPSILRSALMFTCIVIGDSIARKTFIYNSLAASACLLLLINPFWLWDAGFQLSYTAVLSIVIFMKPVYHLFYFSNRLIDGVWQLMAVTLSAQLLTTPVSMFHFHQFPVYFLITNLPAVPLSGLIVLMEIGLCGFAFLPALAKPLGITIHWLIYSMNHFIEYVEKLPFSVWGNLHLTTCQLFLSYAAIGSFACWLMKKNKTAVLIGLCCMLGFLVLRTNAFIVAGNQQQLVIYNIPKHSALDFINGRRCVFMGDSLLTANQQLQNFYLAPSRICSRTNTAAAMPALVVYGQVMVFNNKKIVIIDPAYRERATADKIDVDLMVLSGNPAVSIFQVTGNFSCRNIVFDGSNTVRQVNKWKQEAAKLGLHCYYTVDNGAFVMNMD